jgi:hypothetical protein
MPEAGPGCRLRQAPQRNRAVRNTLDLTKLFSECPRMETYDPQKNATEARQASPRKMNSRVLIFSLIGVVLAFFVIYLVYSMAMPAPTN